MTPEKFKKAKELSDKIINTKLDIEKINFLLKSCTLSTTVSFKAGFNVSVDYTFTDKETITSVLKSELKKYKTELTFLETKFSKV